MRFPDRMIMHATGTTALAVLTWTTTWQVEGTFRRSAVRAGALLYPCSRRQGARVIVCTTLVHGNAPSS